MDKVRIYEFAKEQKTTTKEIMWISNKLNIEVKSHMSYISVEDSLRIANYYNKPKVETKKEQLSFANVPVNSVRNEALNPLNTVRTDAASQQNNARPDAARPQNVARPDAARPQNVARPQNTARTDSTRPQNTARPDAARTQNAVKQNAYSNQGKSVSGIGNQNASKYNKPTNAQPIKNDRNVSDTVLPHNAEKFEKNAINDSKKIVPKKNKTENNSFNNSRNNNNNRRKNDNRGKRFPLAPKPEVQVIKKIVIGETIVVQELAKRMGKTSGDVIKKLMLLGTMATLNQIVDFDTAVLLASEFNINVEFKSEKPVLDIIEDVDLDDTLITRPPVVTVMGHVDHGKTKLLDAIRKTNVIQTEAGGITQHIGAYQVDLINRGKITFLDTPGHEAFTSMRARGAKVTDIAILVVAADDGVMPQTIEAISHAKAAKVPIIVAMNKIDKPAANIDRLKQQLSDHGLVPEDWGGDTIFVPVSALNGEGIDHLLEMIALVAEIQELKANPNRLAMGFIIEARLDKTRGPIATVLVQKGTLKNSDFILSGSTYGHVRAMVDDKGNKVVTAGPAMPVEVLGFSSVPSAGDMFQASDDEKLCKEVVAQRQIIKREEDLHQNKVNLDDLFMSFSSGAPKELNIIIKADVQGSAEAIKQSMQGLNTDEVKVNIIHVGVGAITESDVMLASASNAIIIGFSVRPEIGAKKLAETEKVDIRLFKIIYEAIDTVKAAMAGLLEPEIKESIIGHAEIRQMIKVPKAGFIAGCYILDGKITSRAKIRVLRDNVEIQEDEISSLRRFKDEVKEVATGYECGISLNKFNDFKVGDILEAFLLEEHKREL
ncbi:MAG: translation initiation factor IF-2 [Clostridia bacterium]